MQQEPVSTGGFFMTMVMCLVGRGEVVSNLQVIASVQARSTTP